MAHSIVTPAPSPRQELLVALLVVASVCISVAIVGAVELVAAAGGLLL